MKDHTISGWKPRNLSWTPEPRTTFFDVKYLDIQLAREDELKQWTAHLWVPFPKSCAKARSRPANLW